MSRRRTHGDVGGSSGEEDSAGRGRVKDILDLYRALGTRGEEREVGRGKSDGVGAAALPFAVLEH